MEHTSMKPLKIPDEQCFVLSSIDWPTYVEFGDRLQDRPIRLTYDGCNLEFRTLSCRHYRTKHLLDLLLFVVVEEMDIDIASGGSMTCRREDLHCGLEPDECYWIANEPQIRGRNIIDLTKDPPPDLFLEVEISRSFLDRLAICARLKVPEVWRWDGQAVRVCILGSDGQYTESERGLAFPFLPMTELARFLHMGEMMSETKLVRAFRTWVREQMAHGWVS